MQEMEKFEGEVRFTLVKFNLDKHELVHKGVSIRDQKVRLSDANYRPASGTPLYDAIGRSVRAMEEAMATVEDATGLVVILTDGEENSSREYTKTDIVQLIEDKEEEGWTFTYLGVSMDAWDAGFELGIDLGNTMQVGASGLAMSSGMHLHAQATSEYLRGGGTQSASFYSDSGTPLVVDDEGETDEQ
jgi:hypothetical protein